MIGQELKFSLLMSDMLSVSTKPLAPNELTSSSLSDSKKTRIGQCTQHTPHSVQSQDFTQTCPNWTLVNQHVIYQIHKTIYEMNLTCTQNFEGYVI